MEPRRRARIIIAVFVVVLLAALLWWWFDRDESLPVSVPETAVPTTSLPQGSNGQPATGSPESPSSGQQQLSSDPLRLARLFAERFGSYSTDDNFAGLVSLEPLMTASLAEWVTTQYLPRLRGELPTDRYGGKSTRAIGVTVVEADNDEAIIEVRTQETITGPGAGVTYPTARVELVSDGDAWLVDAIYIERN